MTCFELAWERLVEEFAIAPELRSAGGARKRGERIEGIADPVADFLENERADLIRGGDAVSIHVHCPWAHEHSGDSGPTESVWFLAGTNGYEQGAYRCLHAHCQERGASAFKVEIGFVEDVSDDFEDLGPMTPEEQAKSDEIKAKGGSQWYIIDRSDFRSAAIAARRELWCPLDHKALLRSNAAWYAYQGSHYAEASDERIESDVLTFLDTCDGIDAKGNVTKYNPTNAALANIVKQLRSLSITDCTPPAWLGGPHTGLDPRECMAMANGILHVPTRTLLPHTPDFFSLNVLPYGWAPGAPEPRQWLRFLDEVWPGDREAIDTLQEVMGYLLLPDTSMQKMFMLVGPKRSGKGTINRVITALLGQHNVCSPTIQALTGEFGLEPLIGKLVAMVPDGRVGPKTDTHAFIERLLSISGEDSLNVNRKNKSFWIGKLDTRVLVFSNETPRLGDTSGALPGRFIHLSMRESFYGREDSGLSARLLTELPSILRWALEGRDRLYDRGHFVQPESGKDDADDMADMGNPVGQFIADCCELGHELSDTVDTLYEAWRTWCGTTGHMAGARETFGRSLRVAQPKLRKSRSRAFGRAAIYHGIAVSDEARKNLHVGGF